MERSAPSPFIPVIEPAETRNAQITLCVSFVASLIVARAIPFEHNASLADLVTMPLALITALHHLIIIICAFRQRRRNYKPRDIPHLVPTTAKLGVALTCWMLAGTWIMVTMVYMMEIHWKHQHHYILTGIESVLLFGVSVMCTRERLETMERVDDLNRTRIVFMTGEDGEYMVAEGP
ncbi:hypothetical protein BKA70DRAFT_1271549 [Coprinopsis sp. MPI-PUGE-AT-0042]|nr:hypothetical protein BKA70DRAFT_1271549 [Coprinopsis sp. MPI-PUGE-AT-0042]